MRWSADPGTADLDLQIVATICMEQQVPSRMKDLGHVSAEAVSTRAGNATGTDTRTKTQYYVHIENYQIVGVINYGIYIINLSEPFILVT